MASDMVGSNTPHSKKEALQTIDKRLSSSQKIKRIVSRAAKDQRACTGTCTHHRHLHPPTGSSTDTLSRERAQPAATSAPDQHRRLKSAHSQRTTSAPTPCLQSVHGQLTAPAPAPSTGTSTDALSPKCAQ